jgi:flagellar basal-body rod modification protein FlgD
MPSPISATTPPASSQSKVASPGATLDKNDFLKLFVAQMQHQDPSQPMDNSAMMGQMASFSTLEQISNMASANTQVAAGLAQSNAIALIGKTVSYVDAAGATLSGTVEKVSTSGGKAALTVGGVAGIDPATVTQVS